MRVPANSVNWPMTEIYQIDLTKKQLAAMPEAERRLLLLLGHATVQAGSGQGAPV